MRKLYSSGFPGIRMNRLILFLMGILMVQQLAAHPGTGNYSPVRDTLPNDSLRPDIISFAPTAGTRGSTLFIFGKRFTGASTVSLGGVPTTSFSVLTDSVIRAVVGNGASGAVRVTTPFGTDTACCFRFIADSLPPDITRFTPAQGSRGTLVRIFGRNFVGTTSVRFGNVPASSFSIVSDSLIHAFVGNGASGAVRVTTLAGADTACCFQFITDSLPPDITRFTPAQGSRGTIVRIFGRHFVGTTSVRFGNVPASSFSIVSDSLISAVVGNGASGVVQVINLAGADTACCFTYLADTMPPRITRFTPLSGSTGTRVTIFGRNFRTTTHVSFGGVPATSFAITGDSIISALVGNGASGLVRVVTTAGRDSMAGFVYFPNTIPPSIHSFTPTRGSRGANVNIFGSHFNSTTSVSFGGVPASSFLMVTDSLIIAKVGNGASGVVRVTTLAGTDTACCFTYIADSIAPRITGFTPASGGTGTRVTIVGRNFFNATSVSFGGVPAMSYTVSSDSLITAFVGNGASGVVRVANSSGFDTACCFRYIRDTIPGDSAKPIITVFYPNSARKGQRVEISGRHFTGASSVSFGGVAAGSYQVITDTLIYATVGNGATGVVRVANSNGFDTACCFRYITDTIPSDTAKPNIITFFPDTAGRGQRVEILGSHFRGTTTVSFGGTPAQSFQVITDTLIYAIVGNGSSGVVRVAKNSGFDTACCFTYIPVQDSLAPIIKSFSPTAARSGTVVSIRGLHFTGATHVSFQGVPALTYTVVADTLIRATVWYGASGGIRVSTPYGHDTAYYFTYLSDTIPSDSSWPNITNFHPKAGTNGTVVTIVGTNFTGTNSVSFGRVPAKQFSVLSDSVISAIVDTGATGLVEVRKPYGRDSLGTFTYVPADTVYTFNVAPNPASTYTIVTHPFISHPSLLKLSNVSGHVIQTTKVAPGVTQTRMNLSGVRPGLYKISWTNGKKWYSQTILIQ